MPPATPGWSGCSGVLDEVPHEEITLDVIDVAGRPPAEIE